MMKRHMAAAAAALILLLGGCAESGPAVFEGAAWGMSMRAVQKTKEEGVIVDGPSDNVLNRLFTAETEWFAGRTVTVAYIFTENALSSITVQLFTDEGETLAQAMADTREALRRRLGEDDDMVWITEDSRIELTELEGSDQSYLVLIAPLK